MSTVAMGRGEKADARFIWAIKSKSKGTEKCYPQKNIISMALLRVAVGKITFKQVESQLWIISPTSKSKSRWLSLSEEVRQFLLLLFSRDEYASDNLSHPSSTFSKLLLYLFYVQGALLGGCTHLTQGVGIVSHLPGEYKNWPQVAQLEDV